MAQATNLNPAGLSGPRRCRAARPAAGGSSRLVPRPAGQISPIASALSTSGPEVRGSLTGTPVPQPGSWASARHHDDGDSVTPVTPAPGRPVTVTPTPPPPALPTAACGPRAAGLGYQSPSKIERAAWLPGPGRHGNICMYLSVLVSLPYLYVYRMYMMSVFACMCMYPQ